MIDILLTTYNRISFLKRTLNSIFEKTTSVPYRLFIIDDCSTDGTAEYLAELRNVQACHVILNKERCGIRYGFSLLWAAMETCSKFYGEYPFVCYHQDDVEIIKDGWAEILISAYKGLKRTGNVGFFSGCDSPEHPVREKIRWEDYHVLFKSSQAFQNAIAEKSFWESIGPVPRINPDGINPGFPNNGRGSNLDVWFMGCFSGSRYNRGAASPNCSFVQKKSVMVIPLMRHLGHAVNSTWRRV